MHGNLRMTNLDKWTRFSVSSIVVNIVFAVVVNVDLVVVVCIVVGGYIMAISLC